ncbi:MAG: acetyl-CoA carboxylase biotin carboxyl carrier protein [Chlamydiales bacterium]|nr:acetyl-CoA carboxylase biotin carboxyl carrier protein [Chlamydiales bacterium]
MELKQIKELMTAMERAGIKKLMIKEKTGYEIQLERHEEVAPHPVQQHIPVAYPPVFHPVAAKEQELLHRHSPAKSTDQEGGKGSSEKEEKPGRYVKSPMVGTYYSASSPDDPPFIKVGDRIEENMVICIIEAMKVMNEVKAGMSGTVAEILVDNAHPVEFGTKIIRIV